MDLIDRWKAWFIAWFVWMFSIFSTQNRNIQPQQQARTISHANNNNSNNSSNNDSSITIPETTTSPPPTAANSSNSNNSNNNTPSKNVFKHIDQKPVISLNKYKESISRHLHESDISDRNNSILANLLVDVQNFNTCTDITLQAAGIKQLLDRLGENEKVKFWIVNQVLESFKKSYNISSKQDLLSFYAVLVSCAVRENTKFRKELVDVIQNLPPSVLGDLENRNVSRVLVDLQSDVCESFRYDKPSPQYSHLVAQVSGTVFKAINEHVNPQVPSSPSPIIIKNELLAYLFQSISLVYQSKIIFQQLIANQLVQPSQETRSSILDYLFSYQPSIVINNNSNNATTKTTTTTTTTTTSTTNDNTV
ncbi:hypothetical protein CYY_002849 [Polysphondylium violaceum]|uniref:Uncharacterized protein n=1 Tax=Polysphondylium violaceum TaxID=133409 RepID=A0A8J4PXI8_9MYCE|nr:hypothetical protein CYY_002849 [Polysphondylium violaceum]